MTPHHLHALAAAWSLQAARQRLAELARAETRRTTDSLLAAAPVSSPTYGTIHAIGGHGDPTSATLTATGRPVRVTTWADRLDRLDGKLSRIADMFFAPAAVPDHLDRIIGGLPYLTAGRVYWLARHLADEDAWVRDTIRQPRPVTPLPGVACPHCDQRTLAVQTAGPVSAWTVVCASGGLCTGTGCRCGMPGAVEGVAHIWPRDAVIGASRSTIHS